MKGNYVFNRVFEQSMGQEAICNATAKDFLTGTKVTIFAYGQTGTGKTYTIFGPTEDPGIVTGVCQTSLKDCQQTKSCTMNVQL